MLYFNIYKFRQLYYVIEYYKKLHDFLPIGMNGYLSHTPLRLLLSLSL